MFEIWRWPFDFFSRKTMKTIQPCHVSNSAFLLPKQVHFHMNVRSFYSSSGSRKSDTLILELTRPESRNGEVVSKFSSKMLTRVKYFNSWLDFIGVSCLGACQTQVFFFTSSRAENARSFRDNPGQGLKAKNLTVVKVVLGVSPLDTIFFESYGV
jgi:hypothetical protein